MAAMSVIIPAYNEEEGIAAVLSALKALPLDREIIVVDDGSTDRTAAIAAEMGARVIQHPMNMGYGRSIKDGIHFASTDVIVLSDADGTYPVDRIPELFILFRRGFDMVVGARQGREYRGSFFKAPARTIFRWIVEFATGRRIPDVNSGLRIFRKGDVLPALNDLCNGFSFTTTLTLFYLLTGKMVTFVPIPYGKRIGRSKVRLLRDTLRTLQYVTESLVRYNPIKAFLLFAALTFLCGLLLSAWAGIVAFLLGLFASIIVFAMGLLVYGLRG